MLNFEEMKYMCKSLAKTLSLAIRLYKNKELLYQHSILPLNPDPIILHLDELLNSPYEAGVITTPFFQFYGYFDTTDEYRIIIGPSGTLTQDKLLLNKLLFLLDVPIIKQTEYIKKLNCVPTVTAKRVSLILSILSTAINGKPLYIEDVHFDNVDSVQKSIIERNAEENLNNSEDTSNSKTVYDSYKYEEMLMFCIQNGQIEQLKEILSSSPKLKAGKMAEDTLRQMKNISICSATVSSRAAISGGLDTYVAFGLSDLYIQKFESLNDIAKISKLIDEMMLDFASRVSYVKYGCISTSPLSKKCSYYIVKNIFNSITVNDIATELQLSRSYLCTQFKKQTGITLSQYILNEKIIEAKRLLLFTNKSLLEIAMNLNFSSQSHFQLSFKKITSETPMQFRLKNKNS
ncbi:MAG: AraC family transcriptional regulator [Clostridium sp.]|uniref:AraC family transcriptional regulator n=1 Tax=Clostridium sp. TaxID=1506 RepID=UPI003F30D736